MDGAGKGGGKRDRTASSARLREAFVMQAVFSCSTKRNLNSWKQSTKMNLLNLAMKGPLCLFQSLSVSISSYRRRKEPQHSHVKQHIG